MRTNNPGHLTSFDYLGLYRYFLTFCVNGRREVFIDDAVVSIVRQQILRAASENRFAILAYCFMPDHLHLLVEGESDDADCRRFIKSSKQYSGFYYSNAYRQRLWQRYGYERVLRNDEATLDVARYILDNPLRAGIVRDVREYRFVGSEKYTVAEILEGVSDTRSG
jgi:REP-associated tyrosine transposase